MRRTFPSSYLVFASLLLIPLLLSAARPRALNSGAPPGAPQSASECSDSPQDCKKPVSYLGESKGCACFACEYGKKTQRILCTRSEADKRAFKLLLPRGRIRTD
jgi:hypothetical protein